MSRIKKYSLKEQNLQKVQLKLSNILKIKKQLRKDKNVDDNFISASSCGLCFNGLNLLPTKYLQYIFKTWKHFSGDLKFPVHTSNKLDPIQQFDYNTVSKYTGKYGKARLKLAKHALNIIEKDLKKFK